MPETLYSGGIFRFDVRLTDEQKCFYKCILEPLVYITEDSHIRPNNMTESDEFYSPELFAIQQSCAESTDDVKELCESSYLYMNCLTQKFLEYAENQGWLKW